MAAQMIRQHEARSAEECRPDVSGRVDALLEESQRRPWFVREQ